MSKSNTSKKSDPCVVVQGKMTVRNKTTVGTAINAPDAASAEDAARAAQALGHPDPTLQIAKSGLFDTGDFVVGTEIFIRSPEEASKHIDVLESQVNAAVKAGELTDDAAADAQSAVKEAKQEIKKKDKPDRGKRLLDSVKRISDIFDAAKNTAESTKAIGKVVLKAAPYASAAYAAISQWLKAAP
jgi:hypothetical protein